MIHYLKRNQLDEIKYNNCIKKACNSRIYAYSWYLDIVSDNWDALVLNNYEAVMPLPWRSKYFIKYIYPPAWTQQLGVFSNFEINAYLVKQFVNSIPKKFKKITIQFNSENDVSLLKTSKRANYVLPLNKPYKEIYKEYRRDRKQRLNQASKNELLVKNCSFKELELIAKENYSFLKISNLNYKRLKLLTEFIQKHNKGFLFGVYNKQNILIGFAIYLQDNYRISYLFSGVTFKGKQQQAASCLIDYVFKKYENTNYIFDFEGSMILGIASFFKSFGVQKETYFLYQQTPRLI